MIFEVTDRELDDGVLAVLSLDHSERAGAVGREREVLPSRERPLLAEGPDAPDDEPPVAATAVGLFEPSVSDGPGSAAALAL